ncbi:DUF933 domain-containing protein [Anatilimnocola floriformis]|nr:DUF933 domain-containing protein [Anatilimnocola floriformis]
MLIRRLNEPRAERAAHARVGRTIPVGATAPQAAGVIHSDFEKGFIRAEVYSLEDLEKYGSEKEIRANGKMRVEGKGYIMRDGDICHFLFN